MYVNDLIKVHGYTKNKLSHFNICIYNPITEEWITIKHPTADEYIYLCDRIIFDWMVGEEPDTIDITVYFNSNDYEIFSKYYKEKTNA